MTYAYRPSKKLVAWLVGALAAVAVSHVLMMVIGLVVLVTVPEIYDSEAMVQGLQPNLALLALLFCGLALMALYPVSAVLFCVWAYRANCSARALGAEGMKFTPGWTVGWFFVPFANLFKPYQAMREIYQASDPSAGAEDWSAPEAPSYISQWWGSWVLGNVIGQFGTQFAGREDAASLQNSSLTAIASTILTVFAAVLAIRLIREIGDRQERKHRARGEGLVIPAEPEPMGPG